MICPSCKKETRRISMHYDPDQAKVVHKCDQCPKPKSQPTITVIGEKTGGHW